MRTALVFTLSVFTCVGGSAETAAVQSPVLGFVASAPAAGRHGQQTPGLTLSSSATEVRAILGVPGAAMVGTPVPLPRGIASVYFAPGENYALVEQLEGTMALVEFSGAQAGPLLAVPGAISRPDIVAFNPSASAAAIFSAGEGRVLIITGLPGSPQVSADISVAGLPGIQMLALADDGATLLAGTSDGRVLVLRASGSPELAYSAGALGGIAFAPASTNALVFDGDGSKALLLQNVASAPAVRLLAEGLPGLSGAAVLQFDGGAAVVGAMNAKGLSRIDLETLHVDNMTLPAGLTMLQPLRAPHRFLLSAQPGQPAWILDTSGAAGAVYFVPRPSSAVMAR